MGYRGSGVYIWSVKVGWLGVLMKWSDFSVVTLLNADQKGPWIGRWICSGKGMSL